MSSENQINANRANSQLSTGPITPEGKAKSSHNALKSGLTGRTVLIPTDDVPAYEAHVERVIGLFAPEGEAENELVQNIADTEWRLQRIPTIESGLWALGRRELKNEFTDEPDESLRQILIEAKVYANYKKDLTNLALQERRLENKRDRYKAEILALQQKRKDESRRTLIVATREYARAEYLKQPYDLAANGFEFSVDQVVAFQKWSYDVKMHGADNTEDLPVFLKRWNSKKAA